MKALLSKAPGGPETLTIEEIESPDVGDGEVLITIRAAGVNYPDVLIIEDKYQLRPERPFSPGTEVAGVVSAVGDGVTEFKPGDRVIGYCDWGGMAEMVAVSRERCTLIPEYMPFEEAAGLVFTYGTSHYALKWRGGLQTGEKVLVLGAAGGVGSAAVELAKAAGAEVIAACSSQEKVNFCLAAGADKGLVYPRGELDKAARKALTEEFKAVAGGGVDLVYDAVGGDYAEPALRALNREGRFLVVGFPAGIAKIPLNLPLLKSCDIRGVFWGDWVQRHPEQFRQSLDELIALYNDGKIRPRVSHTYPLAQASQAIAELSARRALGKLVVTLD